jgi:hypothetical protein
MKRSPALQPLSREHHAALKLAKACERAVASGEAAQMDETCQRVGEAFAAELEPHFLFEERELLPAAPTVLAERTLADHARLRELAGSLRQHCDAGILRGFGECLVSHVRFEERELFPAIEKTL